MTRAPRLAIAAAALLVFIVGSTPVLAGGGADFGACVSQHAKAERGFSADHNPGMHHGFAGWSGCPG